MARQRFGQHFLASKPILERIAAAACGAHAGTVVEIGPGHGALTRVLLPRVDRVIAVEIDAELAAELREEFANEPKLTVVEGDALEQDFAAFHPDVICGNLPYYVATPLLLRAVRVGVRVVALIQKEVAERLAAQPGTRDYGYLTCEMALYAKARILFQVKPGAFRPQPKVDSAVVLLEPCARATELGVEPDVFLKFLGACFQHKRKTLRNNLRGFYPKEELEAMEETLLRGEQCPLERLAALYKKLGLALGQK